MDNDFPLNEVNCIDFDLQFSFLRNHTNITGDRTFSFPLFFFLLIENLRWVLKQRNTINRKIAGQWSTVGRVAIKCTEQVIGVSELSE